MGQLKTRVKARSRAIQTASLIRDYTRQRNSYVSVGEFVEDTFCPATPMRRQLVDNPAVHRIRALIAATRRGSINIAGGIEEKIAFGIVAIEDVSELIQNGFGPWAENSANPVPRGM